jgi:hypothetical protein
MSQDNLIIPEVLLISERPMCAPKDMVYSTNPRLAFDSNGHSYCIKGDNDIEIVLSELIGHVLAGFLGIPVPDYAVGRFKGTGPPYFCSSIIEDAFRDVEAHLKTNRIADLEVLAKVILLDIWIANNDRNIGNFLGRPRPDVGSGFIGLVAIDFEKSLTVRSKAPLIQLPALPAGAFWPRGVLGGYCKNRARLTGKLVQDFQSLPATRIEHAVDKCFAAANVGDLGRRDDIADALVNRQQQLDNLAKLEWN